MNRTIRPETSETALQPQPEQPRLCLDLVEPPEDTAVNEGGTVVLAVTPKREGLTYQWLRQRLQGNEILPGQNAPTLTLRDASRQDVGRYLCVVTHRNEVQMTPAASVMLIHREGVSFGTSGSALRMSGAITIETTVVPSGGSLDTCPGSYVGYASFSKTVGQGWGWAPTNGAPAHIATDTHASDTKIRYNGQKWDVGCAQASVTVPQPAVSGKYRFVVYFPTTLPSSETYEITLEGFEV